MLHFCKYINLTNIIPIYEYFLSIHKYLILIFNIHKEYEYISLWLCLTGYFSNERYVRVKKENFLEIFSRKNRYQVFVNYLQILPIWLILFLFLLASFGIHKLFLFLFVQKLGPRIYSYSYLRENLLFADHWYLKN